MWQPQWNRGRMSRPDPLYLLGNCNQTFASPRFYCWIVTSARYPSFLCTDRTSANLIGSAFLIAIQREIRTGVCDWSDMGNYQTGRCLKRQRPYTIQRSIVCIVKSSRRGGNAMTHEGGSEGMSGFNQTPGRLSICYRISLLVPSGRWGCDECWVSEL